MTRGEVSFRLNNIEFARLRPDARGEARITASDFPAGDHFVSAYFLSDIGIPPSNATISHQVIDRKPPPPPPPPANNRFANRIALTLPAAITATNASATRETNEPRLLGTTAHSTSVWWTVTATAPGVMEIDTLSSDIATVVGVFTGNSLSSLRRVAEAGSWAMPLPAAPPPGGSRLAFPVQAGTVYTILVAGAEGAEGTIRLNVSQRAAGPMATTTTLLAPAEIRAGQDLYLSARVTAVPGVAPRGEVTFLRDGVAVRTLPLGSDGHATLRIPSPPVGSYRVTASYAGTPDFLPSAALPRTLRVTRDGAGFAGGGSVFAPTAACAPFLGSAAQGVRVRYSPSELNIVPSGLSIVWPGGAEHLAHWGPMPAEGDFRGAAGRSTWSRFVIYPRRPLIRVVTRRITDPVLGTDLATAQELVLRVRMQNFGAIPGCSATVAAVLRRL